MSAIAVDANERGKTSARRRRIFRRGAGCVVATAEAIAGALAVAGGVYLAVTLTVAWIDGRTIERALSQARSQGAPLTSREIEALCGATPEEEEAAKRWQAILAKPDLFTTGANESGVPFVDYRRGDDGSNPPERDARGLLAGEDLVIASAYAESNRAAIEGAHDARREASHARFPIDLEFAAAANLPHLNPLRQFKALVQLDLEVRLAEGEQDAAVEDVLTLLATSDLLAEEPFLVSQYVRFEIFDVARKGAARLLAGGDLTETSLRRIDEALSRTDPHASFRFVMAGERWCFIDAFETELYDVHDSLGVPDPWFEGPDLAKGLEWYAAIDDAGRSDLRGAVDRCKTLGAEIDRAGGTPAIAADYPVSIAYFPDVVHAVGVHQRAESSVVLLRTAIACERYRLAQGDLPAKLADLVPEFLETVPIDACDGKPLRYVASERGALVYSVGPDLRDDGGGMPPGASGASAFAPSDDVVRLRVPEKSP